MFPIERHESPGHIDNSHRNEMFKWGLRKSAAGRSGGIHFDGNAVFRPQGTRAQLLKVRSEAQGADIPESWSRAKGQRQRRLRYEWG